MVSEQVLRNTTPLDESHDGIKASPVTGEPIVDRDAGDPEPTTNLQDVSPGNSVEICGSVAPVQSVGCKSYRGPPWRLGISHEFIGVVSTLYIDREPYLFDVCNGPIYAVDPSEVKPHDGE